MFHLQKLPIQVKGYASVLHSGSVFVSGGYDLDENKIVSRFFVLKNSEWVELQPMNEKRAYFGIISFEGYIYAFGGENTSGNIEKYDEVENKWESLEISGTEMIRYAFAYSQKQNLLYISGGILLEEDQVKYNNKTYSHTFFDDCAHTSIVEVLDLTKLTIAFHSNLNVPRAYHKMIDMSVLGGQILKEDFEDSEDENQGYITNTETIENFNKTHWKVLRQKLPYSISHFEIVKHSNGVFIIDKNRNYFKSDIHISSLETSNHFFDFVFV